PGDVGLQRDRLRVARRARVVRRDRGLDRDLRRYWRVGDRGSHTSRGESGEECDDSKLAHQRGTSLWDWRRGGGWAYASGVEPNMHSNVPKRIEAVCRSPQGAFCNSKPPPFILAARGAGRPRPPAETELGPGRLSRCRNAFVLADPRSPRSGGADARTTVVGAGTRDSGNAAPT